MNLILKTTILLSSLALASRADIDWKTRFVSAGDADYVTDSDGTTRLKAGADATVGFFIQLIDTGLNLAPDIADLSKPGGAGGDDVVVDVAFFGQSTVTLRDGRLNSQLSAEPNPLALPPNVGQRYFARAWNAVSSNFLLDDPASAPPVYSASLRYGNGFVSGAPANTLFVPSTLADNTNTEIFTIGAFSTTLTAVPEAGTAGLAGLGLLMLRRFLRRKTP